MMSKTRKTAKIKIYQSDAWSILHHELVHPQYVVVNSSNYMLCCVQFPATPMRHVSYISYLSKNPRDIHRASCVSRRLPEWKSETMKDSSFSCSAEFVMSITDG